MHIHVYAANSFLSVKHVFQQVLGHIPSTYEASYLPDFTCTISVFPLLGQLLMLLLSFLLLLLLFHPKDHYKMIMDM